MPVELEVVTQHEQWHSDEPSALEHGMSVKGTHPLHELQFSTTPLSRQQRVLVSRSEWQQLLWDPGCQVDPSENR
ncbi:MAG: hypothetical protein AAGA18_14440 [Verrucomicrobiota bacterium]